jgi:hypothetical protein
VNPLTASGLPVPGDQAARGNGNAEKTMMHRYFRSDDEKGDIMNNVASLSLVV